MNTETEIKAYTLTRDGQRDLKFTGQLLAHASSRISHGERQNRWAELTLFRTKSGKCVVQVVEKTLWQGEENRYAATVCDNADAVIDALTVEGRLSRLAKELLDATNIDCVETIE